MNAMSAAERARRYRQKKKEQGIGQGEATRLGPQAAGIVNNLSAVLGESKAEVVRVLLLRGVTEMLGNEFNDVELVLSRIANREHEEPANKEVLDMAANGLKRTFNMSKDFMDSTNKKPKDD